MKEFVIYWLHKGHYAAHEKILFEQKRRDDFQGGNKLQSFEICFITLHETEPILINVLTDSIHLRAVYCSKVLKFLPFQITA